MTRNSGLEAFEAYDLEGFAYHMPWSCQAFEREQVMLLSLSGGKAEMSVIVVCRMIVARRVL